MSSRKGVVRSEGFFFLNSFNVSGGERSGRNETGWCVCVCDVEQEEGGEV